MTTVKRSSFSPFTPAQMYTLVNDVQAYPAFLPWCVEAAVLFHENHVMRARLKVKKGRFDYAFTTENRLQTDSAIEMHLVEGPFKKLQGQWRFESADGGCLVSFELEFECSGRILGAVLTAAFKPIADSMVEAFRERAYVVYAG
jgi:ribosome-associated toxin RatA of RatAB toxin-antitoxin module